MSDDVQAPPAEGPSDPYVKTSHDVGELFAALAKAQGTMKHPAKNKTAKVETKTGPGYSYNYTDLADVYDAIRAPFAANGLAIIQVPFTTPLGAAGVTTIIGHSSGQWIEGTLMFGVGNARPQELGSVITYLRRYMAGPMAGVASEDDDDANVAQGTGAQTQPKERRETKTSHSAPQSMQQNPPKALPPLQQQRPAPEARWLGDERDMNWLRRVLSHSYQIDDPAIVEAMAKGLKGRPKGEAAAYVADKVTAGRAEEARRVAPS